LLGSGGAVARTDVQQTPHVFLSVQQVVTHHVYERCIYSLEMENLLLLFVIVNVCICYLQGCIHKFYIFLYQH